MPQKGKKKASGYGQLKGGGLRDTGKGKKKRKKKTQLTGLSTK